MKNILFKILPLVAAVLFATSCSKDEGNDLDTIPNSTTTNSTTDKPVQAATENDEEPSMPFTIGVCQDESLSKKGVTETDGKLSQYFTSGDEIEVTGEEIHGTLTMDNTSNDGKSVVNFSGTLYGNGVLKYEAGEDMELHYSLGTKLQEPKQLATSLDLSKAFSVYGYLTATETRNKNATTTVKLKQQTAFLRFTSEFSTPVNIKVPGSSEYTTLYIPGIGTHIIAVPDGSKVKASFLSTEKTIDVSSGTVVYNITRSLPNNKCIPAAFSISENEQVLFSESNIGCRKGSYYNSIYFNTNQWDIENPTNNTNVGTNHANVDNWDLFGWGTWLKAQSQSDPMYTSIKNSDYTWPNTDPHTDAAFSDENPGWFTLTADEWDYLLNTRKMANDNCLRYVRASIKKTDGTMIPGLILFPDVSFNTDETDIKYAFKNCGGVTDPYTDSFENYINIDKLDEFFVTNLGNSNYVFLPAAGVRMGTKICHEIHEQEGERAGYYWTSTSGRVLAFDKTDVDITYLTENYPGCSVRLVYAIPTTKN